jgi:uncharacterized protein (DUF1697 family)
MTTSYVVMLRGVNVSGRNRLPMEELRELVSAAGGEDVRTYIQSGNAVFSSGRRAAEIVTSLEKALEGALGTAVPVLVRSKKELDVVIQKNPFVRRGADLGVLHVTFMATAPKAGEIGRARERPRDGDEFEVLGREVYLRCPNGYGKSKLTNTFFEKTLGSAATTRNWRTVTTLAEMAAP